MRLDEQLDSFPVAVIGMQGVFPDAYDVDSFWQNQLNGYSAVRLIEEKRWSWQDYFGDAGSNEPKTTIRSACQIPNVDKFDHRFFGILPKEAVAMDPQQRLFLQAAVGALEDAGYSKQKIEGSDTAVFVGIGNADYPGMMNAHNASFDMFKGTGLALSCIANRLSFWLDIHGPSESIDTACSGSLVAVFHAIEALRRGDSKLAIAGGTNIIAGPELFIAFEKAGMLSKTARCRTFDNDANGYVRGEGVAAIVLCPFEDAISQGEYIYGVIEGAAINHGGRAHSLTAPNASSQANVILKAWSRANKNLNDACLLETHGTGTPLGDPIEINGILKALEEQNAFSADTEQNTKKIALGALKTHVGHLEASAGIAGLMKAILSLKYKCIPKNLNYSDLNTHINIDNSPLYIPTQNISVDEDITNPLMAGISSFGFGGVNAHVVISSYHDDKEMEEAHATMPVLIPLSARDKNSLLARARQLILFLNGTQQDTFDMNVLLDHIKEVFQLENNVDEQMAFTESTLHQLNIDSGDLFKLTQSLSAFYGITLDFEALTSCLTISELCESIRLQKLNAEKIAEFDSRYYVTSQPAIPDSEKQKISLREIAYGLIEGRDQYKTRVCFIVNSKHELLSKLHHFIERLDFEDQAIMNNYLDEKQIKDKPTDISDFEHEAWFREWGYWWLSHVSHIIDWNSLYPKDAQPKKIPMPSYPFEQVSLWYQSNKVEHLSRTQEQVAFRNLVTTATVEHKDNLVKIEEKKNDSILDEFTGTATSSLNCLAALVDYAIHKSERQHLTLKNIQLGKPVGFYDEQLVFADVLANGQRLFVCAEKGLSEDNRILAGAYYHSEVIAITASDNKKEVHPDIPVFNDLSVQTQINTLVSTSPFVDAYMIENGILSLSLSLSLSLALPEWGSKKSAFWQPVLQTVIDCKNVLADSSVIYYPSHIDQIDFIVDQPDRPIQQLKVWQQSGKSFYSFRTKTNEIVLELSQVTFQKVKSLSYQERRAS